jgi:acetylornithine deacetylase/succinyl-diaminopimelate desuccinylase-like protein
MMRSSGSTFPVRVAALLLALACTGSLARAAARNDALASSEPAFRDLYRELVETNTTLSSGSCTEAAGKMARRLEEAGVPQAQLQVLAPPDRPRSGSLIASYPGRDAKLEPVMLLAHIDVVEARREDWQRDPFKLTEENGMFYARGASDDKAMASIFTDLLVRWAQRHYVPRRGVTLALTCGEETPDTFDGVEWLLATHPDRMRAQFVLNEGASGLLDDAGKRVSLDVQAGEKVYQDFALEATDAGGHSARPTRKNAIVELSAALVRMGAHRFPVSLNDVTRAYFLAQAELQPPEVAADMRAIVQDPANDAAAQRLWDRSPDWNGMMRTTCVPTQITGGHAPNALPQRATANVNCRILPGVPVQQVREEIVRVLADPAITVRPTGQKPIESNAPPLTDAFLAPIRKAAGRLWPGVHVVPTMSAGATDGRYLNAAGIPTYGVSGIFHDAKGSGAHGLDEHVRVQALLDGRRFLSEIVEAYVK